MAFSSRRIRRGCGEPSVQREPSPIVIYLDQSRVSEMIRVAEGPDPEQGGPHREAYLFLNRRLRELVHDRKIICPFSLWHAVETILFPDDKIRAGVCRFFDYASRGRSFRFSIDVFNAEVACSTDGRIGAGPLGESLDCFPAGVIEPLTRSSFEGAQNPFSMIVDLLRTAEPLRQGILRTRDDLLEYIGKQVVRYHGDSGRGAPPPLVDIRREFAQGSLASILRTLIDQGTSQDVAEGVFNRLMNSIDGEKWVDAGIPSPDISPA